MGRKQSTENGTKATSNKSRGYLGSVKPTKSLGYEMEQRN